MSEHPPSRKWIVASLLVSVLGLIDSAILVAQHYRIANEGLMQKSFCTLSSLIDCDTALTSSAAYFFSTSNFRIPNAEIGMLFYLVIGVLALWALVSPARQQSLFSFILAAGALAVVFSVYMASVLVDLGVICLFCIASYILTLAIFFVALKVGTFKIWVLPKSHLFQYILVTALIYGLGTFFFFGLNEKAHAGEPKFNKQTLLRHFYSQEPFAMEIPKRPSWGNPEAPITIIDFSDFQCPFCRRAAFSLKPYLGAFRNQVRIISMNFPLDKSCNPNIKRLMHTVACSAAKASLCAYQKGEGNFWKAHDLIFENQKRLSRKFLVTELAPQVGLSPETMNQCLVSPEIEKMLAQDIQLGINADVHGTPSIYINGRYLRSWSIQSVLLTIISAELERLKDPESFPYTQAPAPEPAP